MKTIDDVLMATAYNFAELSSAKRKQVGAVLSRDGRIIACGYNGTLPGEDNRCEDVCTVCGGSGQRMSKRFPGESEDCVSCSGTGLITSEFVLHAEQNILTFCLREGISTKGCRLDITMAPCKTCSKLVASAGIIKVIYDEVYRDMSGIEFLNKVKNKIETEKYDG